MRTLEYAQPTEQMKLTDVMDLDSAAPIEIGSFLTRELSLVIRDRAKLASRFLLDRDMPWLVCQLCGAALLLVRNQNRFFHFRHHPSIEGLIKCDISTKGEVSSAQPSPDHCDQVQRAKREPGAYLAQRVHSRQLDCRPIVRRAPGRESLERAGRCRTCYLAQARRTSGQGR